MRNIWDGQRKRRCCAAKNEYGWAIDVKKNSLCILKTRLSLVKIAFFNE